MPIASPSRSVKGGMRIAEFGRSASLEASTKTFNTKGGMRNNKNDPKAKIRKEGVP